MCIYIYNYIYHQFEHTEIYRSWCFHLLYREITKQMKKLTFVTKEFNFDLTVLLSTLSSLDFIRISRLINGNVENKKRKVDTVHSKKTLKLEY